MPAAAGLAGLLIVFLVLTPLAGASTYEVWMDGLYDADSTATCWPPSVSRASSRARRSAATAVSMRSLPSALPETTRRPISPIPPRRRPEHLQRREPVAVMSRLSSSRGETSEAASLRCVGPLQPGREQGVRGCCLPTSGRS